jgi:hypothetical protein
MDAKPLLVEIGRRMLEVGPERRPYWRSSRRPMPKPPRRRAALRALKAENERALLELIHRWQAMPPERRTHVLRKRAGLRGSAA